MTDWLGLEGRQVLVAGAGGIGAACAGAFAEVGSNVAVVDVSEAQLATVDGRVLRLTEDLGTAEGCERAVSTAAAQLGGLDVLVHAVGINNRVPVLDVDDELWQQTLEVNLTSAFRLGRAAGRLMVGMCQQPGHGPYAASKGGLDQLIRVMAREWASRGVTVNAVAPGYTETDLTRAHLEKDGVRDHYISLVPAGRLGGVEDLTGPVLFLASHQASFVTGHVMYVDGGRTLV